MLGAVVCVFMIWLQPAYATETDSFTVDENGDVLILKNLGTYGFHPSRGLPSGWGGGLHTWDIYAEGTVGVGVGGQLEAYMNREGSAYFSGSVGIGTTSPSSKLQISSPASDTVSIQGANLYLRGSNQGSGIAVGTRLTYPGGSWLQATVNDSVDAINLLLNPSAGNVGIGTTTPECKLDVDGVIRGNNVSPSDARWKENIEPIDSALDLVNQLRGATYNWVDPSRGDGHQFGIIAQEVEQVLPELVHTDSQGYKSVEYAKLVAPMIEAIKALKARSELLEVENQFLKKRGDDLEERLKSIESKLAP